MKVLARFVAFALVTFFFIWGFLKFGATIPRSSPPSHARLSEQFTGLFYPYYDKGLL